MLIRCSKLCLVLALAVLLPSIAIAQGSRQNAPGKFDFYVLALSWSPSYCEAAGERASRQQCARPYAFVVHGLWPQYENGFPEYCQVPAPRLNRNIVGSMVDLMPAPRLVFHEWDRHGTCSGMSPSAYFETIRKARALVKIPDEFMDLRETATVAPSDVEEAFTRVNSGLQPGGIAVTCDGRRLSEVRICLSKDFTFRECGEIERRSCQRREVVMPPMRGG